MRARLRLPLLLAAPELLLGAAQAQFPASLELGALDGSDGFAITGIGPHDHSGLALASIGDFNGDGIDDICIGAPNASPVSDPGAGQAYVLFGGKGIGAAGQIDLAGLGGEKGFVLFMDDPHEFVGSAVAGAGDVNGDGYADLLVADNDAEGTAYLVFGGPDVAPSGSLALSMLDGAKGFKMEGSFFSANPEVSVASAGDFNADGYCDVIVGLPESNSKLGAATLEAGEACVVFGGPAVGSGGSIQLTALDGASGVQIEGAVMYDACGASVAGLGDFNADGIDDVVVGAPWAAGSNGHAYVVYGSAGAAGDGHLDVAALDPATSGFHIRGAVPSGRVGTRSAGPGDVNSDGFADLLLGAPYADFGSSTDRGEAYVVFGGLEPGADAELGLDELAGMNGFSMRGLDTSDFFGDSVSGAGDPNGDGVPDLVLGAPQGDPHGKSAAGESWLVFGHPALGLAGTLELTLLDGLDGLVLNGGFAGEQAGSVSSAGDLDADGLGDLLVGAPWSWDGAVEGAGRSYAVFGMQTPPPVPHPVLVAFPGTLSMLAPTPHKQVINAGPAYAGHIYWVLGTTSGTEPGFLYGSIAVPLNPDPYVVFTLGHPNSSLMPQSVGVLDAEAKGVSWFIWPDGFVSPALVGLEVHHACGLIDPLTLVVEFVSNAASLIIGT